MNYPESKSTVISKARNMLLDRLLADDMEKVSEIYRYLNKEVADENYAVFTLVEQINLACLTQNYIYMLNDLIQINSETSSIGTSCLVYKNFMKIYPSKDLLEEEIMEKSAKNVNLILHTISVSENISNDEREMIKLVFMKSFTEYLYLYPVFSQDILNEKSADFLHNFPHSKYADYVRNFVRYEYKKTALGGSADLGFLSGFFNGNLKNSFNVPIGFCAGIDVMYKKHIFYLRALWLTSKPKEEIQDTPYGLPILTKYPILFGVGELSYGYYIFENKRFSFSPFVGIGFFEQYFSRKYNSINPNYEDMHKDFFTYTAGINFDINFIKSIEDIEELKIPIRVRLSYVKPIVKNWDYFTGNMLNLSISVPIQVWGSKRVY